MEVPRQAGRVPVRRLDENQKLMGSYTALLLNSGPGSSWSQHIAGAPRT
jgi:hypothetical protein